MFRNSKVGILNWESVWHDVLGCPIQLHLKEALVIAFYVLST